MHSTSIFNYQESYILESGRSIAGLHLYYETFGRLNEDKSNVVWIVHALTANSNPEEWWPGVVGKGFAIDPEENFIICVNNPGSPYGSISPLSIDVKTQLPYFHDFPIFTPRDIAGTFSLLRKELGLASVKLLVGASLGGQIAMEWAILEPNIFKNLLLIATNAKHSAWGIAFNESQRLAIEADQTWLNKSIDAGLAGLKAARSIALLSYRTPDGYNGTQEDYDNEKLDQFKVASYQQYQGKKLIQRYNAFSYYSVTKTMDSHNVGRGRESIQEALSEITANTTILGITSDLLFPIEEQRFLSKHITHSTYVEISSHLGHDGFLTESKKMNEVINNILKLNVTNVLVIDL
jgi:homoserine O-acetyltransferase/O-succinyltransferase